MNLWAEGARGEDMSEERLGSCVSFMSPGSTHRRRQQGDRDGLCCASHFVSAWTVDVVEGRTVLRRDFDNDFWVLSIVARYCCRRQGPIQWEWWPGWVLAILDVFTTSNPKSPTKGACLYGLPGTPLMQSLLLIAPTFVLRVGHQDIPPCLR